MFDLVTELITIQNLAASTPQVVDIALDNRWLLDILPLKGLRSTEGSSPLIGYLPWQEKELEVYRLDRLLGRPEQRLSRSQRVIVIQGEPAWGLLIEEEFPQQERSTQDILAPAAAFALERDQLVEGLFMTEAGPTFLLDPNGLQKWLHGRRVQTDQLALPKPLPWRATPTIERAASRVRAAMFMQTGRQLVTFQTANPGSEKRCFAISLSQVIEVDAAKLIWRLPVKVPGLHGLVIWHDLPIPVLNWEYRLGLDSIKPAANGEKRLLICVGSNGDIVGLHAGGKVATIRLPHVQASKTVTGLFPDRVAGIYDYQDSQLILLDVNLLLRQATS